MNHELIDQLIVGHEHRYFSSPSFKTAVDTLAMMLPAMVAGLAGEAAKQDAKMKAMEAALSRVPTFILHTDGTVKTMRPPVLGEG